MQSLKIGHEDEPYPYLRQIRSWCRWQPQLPLARTNTQLVATYLAAKGLIGVAATYTDMAAADNHVACLIDDGQLTKENCPEIWPR